MTPCSTPVRSRFGPPILRPPSFRDFYAFERHVRTTWGRRGQEIPEAWYRLPVFYFSNVSELRGPDDPVWAPRGSTELDYELEVGALIDTPARDLPAERGEEAIGGYLIVNDWSARDLQRDETPVRLGPAKGKDFALSIGPWLVTPDELADARVAGANGPDLAMTATIRVPDGEGMRAVETTRGTWSTVHFSFGEMVARASSDVHPAPGRPARIGDGRRRLPAGDPRRDAGSLSCARRRGRPRDRAARPAPQPGGGETRLTARRRSNRSISSRLRGVDSVQVGRSTERTVGCNEHSWTWLDGATKRRSPTSHVRSVTG